ncbi:MAG: beta-ketoacyl synthase chain length factor [Actinomycetota bacterium]|nr:beta-ketoacyl synthase chain length factor [Actinomycetota bacterium]
MTQSADVLDVLPGTTVRAHVRWSDAAGEAPPALPGFMVSSFSPLAAEIAERCLREVYGQAPVTPAVGERIAIILVSVGGDVQTGSAVARSVEAGKRVAPLLFFQSVPNAVVGYVTKRWGLLGPVVCTSPIADPMADALAVAELLFADDAADQALLLLMEQGLEPGRTDTAEAVLVAKA